MFFKCPTFCRQPYYAIVILFEYFAEKNDEYLILQIVPLSQTISLASLSSSRTETHISSSEPFDFSVW